MSTEFEYNLLSFTICVVHVHKVIYVCIIYSFERTQKLVLVASIGANYTLLELVVLWRVAAIANFSKFANDSVVKTVIHFLPW